MIRARLVDKSRGLLAIHLLGETGVEECIVDVHLVNWPLVGGSDGEHNPDRGSLDDGREGLVEVNTRALREAADDPSCLVPFK